MTATLALLAVVLTGLYFVTLAMMALCLPSQASRFLLGFASSAFAHYAELLARFVAGGAFVLSASRMMASGAFAAFGWVLLVTTAGLLLIPWRWHRRFASGAVPRVTRHIRLLGWASLAIGVFILGAVARGAAA